MWSLERVLGAGDGSPAGGNAASVADRVTALRFSPDGRTLASGGGVPSREGEIILWDVATATPLAILDMVPSVIHRVAFLDHGNALFVAGKQAKV